MSIKKRLLIAFCIVLFVPWILLCISTAAIWGIQQTSIERTHFENEDSSAKFYMIKSNSSTAPSLRITLIQTLIVLFVITISTAVTLVAWLYRGIVRPLKKISEATQCIQDGNLDFTIASDRKDEFGQLCNDFDEMRSHLKEQIEARLKYESDTIELISNISHDLKTPLTAIKGYSEGLLDGVADTQEKHNKYIKTIYTKASDMQLLVDELSFYSKIDSDIIPYHFERVNISDYFTDCIDELNLDMELRNITLSYQNTLSACTTVVMDADRLRRVVNNIIGNSEKYMDKTQGFITITTSDEGAYVRVDITDNGPGISESDLPHIFDRFFRADTARCSKQGGSGLGLAIAKKIIEDHDGTISATSTKDKGTTISFTIPKCNKALPCDEADDSENKTTKSHKKFRL